MLFTAAPRPACAALVRAVLRAPGMGPDAGAGADTNLPGHLWRPAGRGGSLHWFSRGAWAMAQTAKAAGKPAPAVWLPDYFCHGAETALRGGGARITYYPVTNAMTPDWPACRAMAAESPPDMFVLVHTFGAENDTGGARAFADEHGALLLEDAAHVLRPGAGVGAGAGRIGQAGDAVFFSPHKWLALPDGAVLWLRDGLSLPSAPDAAAKRASAAGWAAKRMAQAVIPQALQPAPARRGPQRFLDDPPPGALPPPGISALSCALLGGLPGGLDESALDKTAAQRRANHRAWAEVLAAHKDISVFGAGAEAPYRCVIDAGGPDNAAAVWGALRGAGVPAESWPDMPPEVTAAGRHAAAHNLRRRMVLAPVHQNINENEIRRRGGHAAEILRRG